MKVIHVPPAVAYSFFEALQGSTVKLTAFERRAKRPETYVGVVGIPTGTGIRVGSQVLYTHLADVDVTILKLDSAHLITYLLKGLARGSRFGRPFSNVRLIIGMLERGGITLPEFQEIKRAEESL